MATFIAFLIFAGMAAASWYISIAVYKSTYPAGPHPTADPNYRIISLFTIVGVGMTGLISFPGGYIAGMIGWMSAVFGFLEMPTGRGAVLVSYLAIGSILTRLILLGVLAVV